MIKITDKQLAKVKELHKNVQLAQMVRDTYLEACGSELNPDKKWDFDFNTGEFKEIKNDTNKK